MLKVKLLVTYLILSIAFLSNAQNLTSYYSYFGLGDIARKGFGQSRAMGGIVYGLRTFNQINYLNPASYTAQDTNSFLLDVSLSGNSNKYKSSTASQLGQDINLHNIAMGFPIFNWWKASMGLVPYSNIGYDFSVEYNGIAGKQIKTDKGFGGLNQFYLGNAFNISNHLALGFNATYLFGYTQKESLIEYPDDSTLNRTKFSNKNSYGDIFFDFGFQYFNKINDKWNYTIGAAYNHNTKINVIENKLIQTIKWGEDTVLATETGPNANTRIELPKFIGAGFTIEKKDQILFGVDYSTQLWKESNSTIFNQFVNSQSINAGIQYIPSKFSFRNYWKRINYRAGGHFSTGYLNLNNTQINDKGFSVGIGLPFKYTNTTFNFTYEYGIRGTTKNGLIEENYNVFMINLSFYDFWFFKPKIN